MITGPPPKFHGSWDILRLDQLTSRLPSSKGSGGTRLLD